MRKQTTFLIMMGFVLVFLLCLLFTTCETFSPRRPTPRPPPSPAEQDNNNPSVGSTTYTYESSHPAVDTEQNYRSGLG